MQAAAQAEIAQHFLWAEIIVLLTTAPVGAAVLGVPVPTAQAA
jgi:hypothetical protein